MVSVVLEWVVVKKKVYSADTQKTCLQNTGIAFRLTCHISMAKRVAFRNRLAQHQKKQLGNGLSIPIPFIHAYNQNTPTFLGTFAILVLWWGGEQ